MKNLFLLLLATLLVGCGASKPVKVINVSAEDAGGRILSGIEICRPSSIVRAAEAPDLHVNGELVAELSNGTSYVVNALTGDEYTLSLKASPLLYRFKDEMLISRKIDKERRFYILRGLSNISQGMSVMFGGAIAESARQNSSEEDSSGSWQLDEVSEIKYRQECSDSRG